MTPQQQLACSAQQIAKCLQCNQTLEMAALIAVFSSLAGMPVDCDTLIANATAYQCVPRNLQLPALLYLATQIISTGGGSIPVGAGFVYAVTGTSHMLNIPPNFTPPTPAAIAVDTITQEQWQYTSTNGWT